MTTNKIPCPHHNPSKFKGPEDGVGDTKVPKSRVRRAKAKDITPDLESKELDHKVPISEGTSGDKDEQ